MSCLVWSSSAASDLERLDEFLLKVNPGAVQRAAQLIDRTTRSLLLLPAMGRIMPHFPAGVREVSAHFGRGAYIIRYCQRGEDVLILRVKHSRELTYPATEN